jgi:hypothetical protein
LQELDEIFFVAALAHAATGQRVKERYFAARIARKFGAIPINAVIWWH